MKSLVLTVVITFVPGVPAVSAAPKHTTMNVMSWNVRYNNPRDGVNAWPKRKDWVGQIIVEQKVDVAGLQEVRADQLDDLKIRLPKMSVYGVGRDDGKRSGEFTPIFFRSNRFELLDKSTFWLSPTPGKVGSVGWDAAITRIASWVKLSDRSTGGVFYVINTHFDHRGAQARAESSKLLVKRLKEQFDDHPVVLTGDFNTTPQSGPYKTLVAREKDFVTFHDTYQRSATKPVGPNSTWSGFRAVVPKRRIDYIFVTNAIDVLRLRILDNQREGRFPSDHLPVLVEIRLGKD